MPITKSKKLPYFTANKILWGCTIHDGADGCEIVRQASLSMDKDPPPLPAPKSAKPPARRLTREERADKTLESLLSAIESISRFKAWLNEPPSPTPPKQASQPKAKQVPPFDIQEIPDAMRKERMPVSAKLMDRWFSGELNYSPTSDDQRAEINQNGHAYPESMIDRTTIKMDWVLKHPRARKQYENLVSTAIYSPNAYHALQAILAPYRRGAMDLSPWSKCGYDIRTLHRIFQFQRTFVDATFEQKAAQFVRRVPHATVPDDLTAALGAFNFYAAIAGVRFAPRDTSATVTHIVVYVRDGYSFEGPMDTTSQYLGHWSKNGVIVVPEVTAANFANVPWLDYPVVTGDLAENLFRRGKVYYPVRNRSFRECQRKHHRGGDFIIYSDYKPFLLEKPITVYFS